jgi:hypothetical protein
MVLVDVHGNQPVLGRAHQFLERTIPAEFQRPDLAHLPRFYNWGLPDGFVVEYASTEVEVAGCKPGNSAQRDRYDVRVGSLPSGFEPEVVADDGVSVMVMVDSATRQHHYCTCDVIHPAPVDSGLTEDVNEYASAIIRPVFGGVAPIEEATPEDIAAVVRESIKVNWEAKCRETATHRALVFSARERLESEMQNLERVMEWAALENGLLDAVDPENMALPAGCTAMVRGRAVVVTTAEGDRIRFSIRPPAALVTLSRERPASKSVVSGGFVGGVLESITAHLADAKIGDATALAIQAIKKGRKAA